MMAEAFVDTFPPGVVNLICGSNQVGEWLTTHPDIAKISFTGSTRTGKAIQKATADTMKRITLECGGNDPAIILPSADPKEIAPQIFGNAMNNSGQVCIAITRCYVHESMADALIAELTECAKKAKMDDGTLAVSDLPNYDATLLLVIYRHDTLSTAVSFESYVFTNLLHT